LRSAAEARAAAAAATATGRCADAAAAAAADGRARSGTVCAILPGVASFRAALPGGHALFAQGTPLHHQ